MIPVRTGALGLSKKVDVISVGFNTMELMVICGVSQCSGALFIRKVIGKHTEELKNGRSLKNIDFES